MTNMTAETRNKETGKSLEGKTQALESIPSTLENLIPRLELADLLRLTPRSLDRWAWQRKGPRRFKIGNKSYYDRADVEAWLERQKAKGFGEAA